jgi:hypothetical protein
LTAVPDRHFDWSAPTCFEKANANVPQLARASSWRGTLKPDSMNYSLHTNYQTSFRIARNDDQTYFNAIYTIFEWLCTKEKDRTLRAGWKNFSFKGLWERCYKTNARVLTATCIEDENRRAWALEYSHVDRDLGAKRFWHTHLGIRDNGEALIVAARVAYSWNSEDLSTEAPAPLPSVPYFVRTLLKNFVTYSGRKEFPLIEKPRVLKAAGAGKIVSDFVFSPERRYPLIVFNGDAEIHLKESNRLSTELAGKAQVVVIGSDPMLGQELRDAFPWDFHIGYQRMRVFFPFGSGPRSSKRHRWFDVGTPDYEAQREGIVHGLLRNHNLVERDSVESIGEIQRLMSKARIKKLQESTEGASEQDIHSLYQDYIQEVEEARDIAKKEAEDYAQQVDQLEYELNAAEWKSKTLENASASKLPSIDVRSCLFTLPKTLLEVVQVAAQIHCDRLIFAKEAFDSAEESSKCELVSDAWHILSHLATTLFDLRFNTDEPGDIGRQFEERSGYEYARTEGKQTKADSMLTRLRKITHNGKEYEIWPHIKKGNDGNKMIRIHFDFDGDKEKIVIGYVGLHMDNASTRGRK